MHLMSFSRSKDRHYPISTHLRLRVVLENDREISLSLIKSCLIKFSKNGRKTTKGINILYVSIVEYLLILEIKNAGIFQPYGAPNEFKRFGH